MKNKIIILLSKLFTFFRLNHTVKAHGANYANKKREKINFKIVAILIFSSVFFSLYGAASNQKIIEEIRREKEATDKLKMTSKEEEVFDSVEGGTATYYYSGNTLKKIIANLYHETGESYIEYYIKNNKVYFIYDKRTYTEHWDIDPDQKIIGVEEERYYLDSNKKLVRYIDSEGKIYNNASVLKEIEEDLKMYIPSFIGDRL